MIVQSQQLSTPSGTCYDASDTSWLKVHWIVVSLHSLQQPPSVYALHKQACKITLLNCFPGMCRFTSDGQDANPTHNAQGEELSTSDLKKGKSAADKARKLRHFYDTQVREKGASFLKDLDSEIKEAEAAFPENYTLC